MNYSVEGLVEVTAAPTGIRSVLEKLTISLSSHNLTASVVPDAHNNGSSVVAQSVSVYGQQKDLNGAQELMDYISNSCGIARNEKVKVIPNCFIYDGDANIVEYDPKLIGKECRGKRGTREQGK